MDPNQALQEALATVRRLLRASRPVEHVGTPSRVDVHLVNRPECVVCRLVDFGHQAPAVLVPLPVEQVANLVPLLEAKAEGTGWSRIMLGSRHDVRVIGPALCAAWDALSASTNPQEG